MSTLVREYRYDGLPLGGTSTCKPKMRYGHGQRSRRTFYHVTESVRIRWVGGRLWAKTAVWACGGRSTRPRFSSEAPTDMAPCPHCFDVIPRGAA